MSNMNDVTVDDCLKLTGPDNVITCETPADPEDNREAGARAVLDAIAKLLRDANLSSENQFTVVIDVQGSTESGRIIQCAVIDTFLGPLHQQL